MKRILLGVGRNKGGFISKLINGSGGGDGGGRDRRKKEKERPGVIRFYKQSIFFFF